MPLQQGSSREVIEANIKELIASGKAPDVAAAIAYKEAGVSKDEYDAMDESARQFNEYGWMTVEGNPISKVGVFPYLGSQIGAPEPKRVYMVYRPAEELNNPETIESFKLTPFINEHPEKLLGNVGGLVATDNKRVEGVIGEKVYFEYPYLKANLRVYSAQTLDSIDSGKEEVSAGYRCVWSREDGVFEGQPYQYAQRNIRGNHSALVVDGRSGPDVSVMDSMTFKLEPKEQQMELAELVKAVAALTNQVTSLTGAMDSMKAAMDESEKDEKKDEGMDEDETEAEKKAEEEAKAKEKGEGMDAKIAALQAEIAALKSKPAAMDAAGFAADLAKKSDLANRLSHHIGAFDHAAMDHAAVAAYGAEKLGLDKAHAVIAVESFLKARPAATAYGMDAGAAAQSTGAAFLAAQLK